MAQLEPSCVGVDGCRAGWIAVSRTSAGLVYRIHESFSDLVATWTSARHIFVDIPIGLPSGLIPARACDVEARRRLGPGRASSVFAPPCRKAAHAANIDQAREFNRRELGKSLSAQAWGICPKIAEVDLLLCSRPALQDQVKEVHPELSFWALNCGRPMQYAKKNSHGAAERMAVLEHWVPGACALIERVLIQHRRSEVGRDDVVDALAAMVTASAGMDRVSCLPAYSQADARGLPMCMWVPDLTNMSRAQ
jgi:predicted RNase H-like nuclease